MPTPSVTARVCDLLGDDPFSARESRPTVRQAARGCPRGGVVAARKGTQEVAVVTLEDGRRFVVPDRCPHDGRPLSDGFVEAGRLVCSRHGWEFDLRTGECAGRPAVCLQAAELP